MNEILSNPIALTFIGLFLLLCFFCIVRFIRNWIRDGREQERIKIDVKSSQTEDWKRLKF